MINKILLQIHNEKKQNSLNKLEKNIKNVKRCVEAENCFKNFLKHLIK